MNESQKEICKICRRPLEWEEIPGNLPGFFAHWDPTTEGICKFCLEQKEKERANANYRQSLLDQEHEEE